MMVLYLKTRYKFTYQLAKPVKENKFINILVNI